MGTPVLTVPASKPPTKTSSKSCLPSPASPSPPASPWPLLAACAPPPCRLPSCCPPPPPSLTLTLLPSSLEPALPPSVLPGPELELAPSLAPHHRIRQEPLPEAAAVLLRLEEGKTKIGNIRSNFDGHDHGGHRDFVSSLKRIIDIYAICVRSPAVRQWLRSNV